jgi:hypothetical protein
MRVIVAVALLAISQTCSGVEPPIPEPPETGAASRQNAAWGPAESAEPPIAPAYGWGAFADPCPPAATVVGSPVWGVRYLPEAVVPGANAGLHVRYPYYSYRRPWYHAGPPSVNVSIIW